MSTSQFFARPQLADCVPDLVATARGDKKATLVIKNAKLVNVCSGEIQDGISIGVQGSRIAFVGADASHMIGADTKIIDAAGRYVAPGVITSYSIHYTKLYEKLDNSNWTLIEMTSWNQITQDSFRLAEVIALIGIAAVLIVLLV